MTYAERVTNCSANHQGTPLRQFHLRTKCTSMRPVMTKRECAASSETVGTFDAHAKL